MTPEQLTRLSALLAKDQLTGSENQELAFLKSIATPAELSQASGDGDGDDEEEEEEEEEEAPEGGKPAADAPQAGKPGVLDHARALTSSKASLVKRNGELVAQVGRLTAQVQQLTASIGESAKAAGEFQTQIANLKAEIGTLRAANKSLSAKVSEELAGLGVKDKDLPPPKKDGDEKTYGSEAEVNAALEGAKNFEERAAILEAWEKSQG